MGWLSDLLAVANPGLGHALVEAGMEQEKAEKMSVALADLDTRLFKEVALSTLKDNSVAVEVRCKVKDILFFQLDRAVESKVFDMVEAVMGSKVAVMSAGVAPIVASVLKDGTPFSVTVVVTTALVVGLMALSYFILSSVQRLRAAIRGVQSAIRSQVVMPVALQMVQVNEMPQDKILRDILGKTRSAPEMLSPEVARKIMTITAIGCLHEVTEYCGKIVSGLQGTLLQGASFAGIAADGRAATQGVKLEMDKMMESVRELRDDLHPKIKAITQTAVMADRVADDLRGFNQLLLGKEKALAKLPDFLLSSKQKEKHEQALEQLGKRAKELVGVLRQGCKECEAPLSNFDHREISDRCLDMIRALAYTPAQNLEQRKAVQDAINTRTLLAEDHLKSAQALASKKSEQAELKDQMRRLESTYQLKLSSLEERMLEQKTVVSKQLQGSFHLSGTAPRSDSNACKIEADWDAGRFGDLPKYSYSSGSFKYTFNSKMTPRQEEAQNLLQRYIDDIDALKEQHQCGMSSLQIKLDRIQQAELPNLEEAESAAKNKVREADTQKNPTKAWLSFQASNPVEYANIQLLFAVNEHIDKVSQWLLSPAQHLTRLKNLTQQLEDEVEDGDGREVVRALKPIVQEMMEELGSPSKSYLAVLKEVGEFELKKVLMPRVKLADLAETTRGVLNGGAPGNVAIEIARAR